MKKSRRMDGETIKHFFGGSTGYLIAGYLSLLTIFAALLRLNAITPFNGAFAMAMAALLLAGYFYVIYTRVASPLREINKAARAMSLGNLEYRLPIYSNNELGRLAGNLNALASRLKDTLIQIRDAKNIEQAILNNMTDGVIAVNDKGEVLFINHVIEEMLGISQLSAFGKNVLGVIRNYEVESILEKALKYVKPLSQEVLLLTPEPKTFHLRATPLVVDETGRGGVLILFHDITERKKIEEMRSEFVANISHELRTPLTSIRGFLETLLDGAQEDPAATSHFLGIMSKETDRLTKLVDELLNLSKIEGRRVIHRWQQVRLNDNINLVATMFLPQVREKNLELITGAPPDLPAVYGDPDMLTQVLINLVDNAVKYTPAGGRISIQAIDEGTDVRVVVKDTGVGIPPESLPRVFERFYRVDKARSRELGGIGVGLAIVKHIIRAHGGKTFAESKVGEGSVFSFTLPVDRGNPAGNLEGSTFGDR
ncbi:MAG: cell wall metabolism sensor histidine kinase WalK [Peptococcaceae bacterium]|nr:cell wall metabolism sensor histidine kinase WalK [Peptococcaceae bacterium]